MKNKKFSLKILFFLLCCFSVSTSSASNVIKRAQSFLKRATVNDSIFEVVATEAVYKVTEGRKQEVKIEKSINEIYKWHYDSPLVRYSSLLETQLKNTRSFLKRIAAKKERVLKKVDANYYYKQHPALTKELNLLNQLETELQELEQEITTTNSFIQSLDEYEKQLKFSKKKFKIDSLKNGALILYYGYPLLLGLAFGNAFANGDLF